MGRDSANFWSYSANLRTDSADFGTISADSPDDSANPLLITFFNGLEPIWCSLSAGSLQMDSADLGRDSANFWSYSANLRTDSAEFGTISADSPDDSAKPLLITFFLNGLEPINCSFNS
ncbi:hypothetical protein COE25_17925 [Bacillus sp. AFS031507]|nr:hypothetical protein COE25_17925 [Bacillus sp. AFS031507]